MVEKYKITDKNIFNFDEKRFMIEVGIIFAQVMSLKEMKSREIIETNQDKNKKYVLLLAAICVVAMKIPSCFMY